MAQFGNQATWGFDPAAVLAGSPSYVDVAELVSINFDGISADALESTVHGQSWRTRVPGLKDAGTVTIEVRLDPSQITHEAVIDEVGTLMAHRFQFPDSTGTPGGIIITTNGIITSASLSAPHDDLLSMSVTVQLSGEPNIVVAGS
jgi:hypothetical protein